MEPSWPKPPSGRGRARRGKARPKKRSLGPAPSMQTAIDAGSAVGANSQIFCPPAASSAKTLSEGEVSRMTSITSGLHSMVERRRRFRGVEDPRGLELRDVRTVDLAQLRILGAGEVSAVHRPLTGGTVERHRPQGEKPEIPTIA